MNRQKVKKCSGEKQAEDGARNAENAAGESHGKFRLQDENNRHGNPIGTAPIEVAAKSVAGGDREAQTQRMAKNAGTQIQVGVQRSYVAAEAQPERLLFFFLLEGQGTFG